MLVYSNSISPRLQYITDFIGKEISGEAFQLTSDINKFKNHQGPKINYSRESITAEEFRIENADLLFENDIRKQNIECFQFNEHKAFFKTEGDFPFDIFTASFYLLSRYEEYLPHEKDRYGRFAHKNSLAYKETFLDQPLINHWLKDFKKLLQEKFPSLTTKNSAITFLPTYDIDMAWSYLHKSWWRNVGGSINSIINACPDTVGGQWASFRNRIKVLSGKEKDPFDSFAWMDQLHTQFKLKPYYFF